VIKTLCLENYPNLMEKVPMRAKTFFGFLKPVIGGLLWGVKKILAMHLPKAEGAFTN